MRTIERQKSRHCRNESDPLLGMYSMCMRRPSNSSAAPPKGHPLRRGRSRSGSGDTPPNGGGGYGSSSPAANGVMPSPSGSASSFQVLHEIQRQRDQQRRRETCESIKASSGQTTASPASPMPKKRKKKGGGYRVHRVSYTPHSHINVIFRMYGSAYPQVLPFVVANVLWTVLISILKENDITDLTFHSSVGHSFMGLLVSFLIVSRSQISYDRFMRYRRHLAECYLACRELSQHVTVFSMTEQTEAAAWWRQEVCYRTILLLRVTMDALLWSSVQRENWEDEYFRYDDKRDGAGSKSGTNKVSQHFYRAKLLSHGHRSYIDENFRAPVTFSHLLRVVIMEHPYHLGYKLAVNEYRDLLMFVGNFMKAFHSFRVLVFTPYPFPILQMTRTFLFFWVYSLPMVLLKDYRLWSSILIVISVSFGFIGVEYVSMSLDDPFGDDTNDIDEHGMSLLVYEDIYLAIYRTDGPEAAAALRDRVLDRYRGGRELDCYREDLKGYDVWEMPDWLAPDEHGCNGDDDHVGAINV